MKLIDSVILDCYNHSVWSDLTDLTNCRPETKVKKGALNFYTYPFKYKKRQLREFVIVFFIVRLLLHSGISYFGEMNYWVVPHSYVC